MFKRHVHSNIKLISKSAYLIAFLIPFFSLVGENKALKILAGENDLFVHNKQIEDSQSSYQINDHDRLTLSEVGFNDRDIWDICLITGFFNMTNRLAIASEMEPNDIYHNIHR